MNISLSKNYLLALSLLFLPFLLLAQMTINGNIRYGNEWINYEQNYVKISLNEDGIYELSYEELQNAGVFSGTAPTGANLQVFYMGEEIPIQVSNNGNLSSGDYIRFYGKKNRGELDVHLYLEDDFQLNPKNSLFTDTSAYFLTWNSDNNHQRFQYIPYDGNNLPPAENYCWKYATVTYFNKWAKGKRHGDGNARYCTYDIAEGFAATPVSSQNVSIATPQVYAQGPNAQLAAHMLTEGGDHDIGITINANTILSSDAFNNWNTKHYDLNFSPANLTDNNTVVIADATNEKLGVAYIEIKYPHTFDFENKASFLFEMPPSASAKYFEISNFNHGGAAPLLYDLSNNLLLQTSLSGNTVLCKLPPSTQNRQLFLLNPNATKTPLKLEQRTFVDYAAAQAEYLIVSNQRLFDDGTGHNYVQEYADYRAGAAGGNFATLVAEVQQLYDQYAYGINRHEMAIKNFVETQIQFGNLQYLFLIGDGRRFADMHNTWLSDFFVPTFGHPTSDHLIATNKGEFVPKIPVGRLAAQNAADVQNYLQKVQEYESNLARPQTIEQRAWMKRIVHLGGGDLPIQNVIQADLNELKDIIENSTMGPKVTSFFKNSTDVIQETPSEQIHSLLTNGVSMMSFYGHSAPATLDFSLEDPQNYNISNGKYPIFYNIGCHTARMMEFNGTIAEDWVHARGKGAIAVIGATWLTAITNLSAYARFFYQNFGNDLYGQRLGDIQLETIRNFNLNSSFLANQLKQVIILHGDPALKLNHFDGPDYLPDETTITISPSLINTQMDSFQVQLDIANIGSAVSDSVLLNIQHVLPNGEVIPSTQIADIAPAFSKSYQLSIPIPDKDILGFNKLRITIDALDSIPELPEPIAEMNNSLDFSFYVIANDAFPVYPYEYSIVNSSEIKLKASTANAFADKQKYFLQIDTTAYFDSPSMRETVIEQSGGLLEWSPPVDWTDNTVYYWRVSIDSTLTTGFGFNWHSSSFLYRSNTSEGWNQSHFFQLKEKNKLTSLQLEDPHRKFAFKETFHEVQIKTGPWSIGYNDQMSATLNGGVVQIYNGMMPNGLHVSVFHPATMEFWVNPPPGLYGSINNKPFNIYSFPFATATVEDREKLINFLENIVPPEYYVAIYSIQKTHYSPYVEYYYDDWALDSINNSYQKNIFQVLEEQGATKIRQLEDFGSVPYLFFYQKDNPDFLQEQNYMTEAIANTVDTILISPVWHIGIPNNTGSVSSTLIGPAKSWQSLQWNLQGYDVSTDLVAMKLYGLTADNLSTLLHNNIFANDTSLAHIDAQQYPYIRLEYAITDTTHTTPPHLQYWRVLYEPAPDATLRPDVTFDFHADTLQQGQTLSLSIAVENISQTDMDSLLVHYTVFDQNNTAYLTQDRMAPLTKGTRLSAQLDFDTRHINTHYNQLLIELNPDYDQPEQYRFNNIGIIPFYIINDQRNPLLDVTFDGQHILDGDIVSAKPLISISLLDENQYLPLSDTALFRVKILYPEESTPQLISLSDPEVTFIPADENNLSEHNKARIEIKKHFEKDGIYQLIVEAKDATGNPSGDNAYKTRFEVINKQMISNLFNYPNPFSTRTRFVFTLTGAELPDFMKIQIMTPSGKVVREITQDELGPIHIGKNLTEYFWDGTDQYGDRLGNGVYLYRVVTRKADGSLYED
ncbi:MAG TPA: hypothetical protein ENJ45_02110, partial [Phaeodactylibacter sp.]|nr:hypothetical protein [Phaeodactylibacter sp.]